MFRFFLILIFCCLAGVSAAQEVDRSATGGAQTLEDILARQRGEVIDDRFRSDNIGGSATTAPGAWPAGRRV